MWSFRLRADPISIHKALAGLDKFDGKTKMSTNISIHKALAGLDIGITEMTKLIGKFQSTRPSRASTAVHSDWHYQLRDFNPQGPRGPRLSH